MLRMERVDSGFRAVDRRLDALLNSVSPEAIAAREVRERQLQSLRDVITSLNSRKTVDLKLVDSGIADLPFPDTYERLMELKIGCMTWSVALRVGNNSVKLNVATGLEKWGACIDSFKTKGAPGSVVPNLVQVTGVQLVDIYFNNRHLFDLPRA
jgi:hypothetical protein